MKKPIQITSLAMRFQLSDGWTEELLAPYVMTHNRGSEPFVKKDFNNKDHYLLPAVGTVLNVKGLIDDGHVGDLVGKESWSELDGLSDLAILEDRTW
jgi:hypothetical protein